MPTSHPPAMEPGAVPRILQPWWERLEEDRADRAQLRRASDLVDVMMTPAFHRLRRLASSGGFDQRVPLALVAGVLAHVQADSPGEHPALQMARSGPAGRAVVSHGRFQRLLRCQDHADLFRPMVRVLPLVERTADVERLGVDLYRWGEPVRLRWAEWYYENAPEEKPRKE